MRTCDITYKISKLTLSVDPEVVARAKQFAQRNKTSVSEFVQSYLSIVSKPSKPERRKALPPVLRSLRDLVKDDGVDYREEALQMSGSDCEDCVTAAAARRSGCAFIVTSDPRGFRASPVEAVTPKAAIGILRGYAKPRPRNT